jgi:CheY-like chemotaxis protein
MSSPPRVDYSSLVVPAGILTPLPKGVNPSPSRNQLNVVDKDTTTLFQRELAAKAKEIPSLKPFDEVRVLVVEDQDAPAKSLGRVLERIGFSGFEKWLPKTIGRDEGSHWKDQQVLRAITADDAIAAVSNRVVDFVFMDNRLIGEKRGLTAAQEITTKYQETNKPVPVMFFTSSDPCPEENKHLFKAIFGKVPLYQNVHETMLELWPKTV